MENAARTWLAEVLDIVEHRRRTVLATALGVSIVGLVVSFLAPDVLPPNPFVGAAVGAAAVLLAIAAALGVDSVDLTIRGSRHVRAAGGDVVAELVGRPDPQATLALADALEPRGEGPVRVALAPVSRSITTVPRWTDALAVELSRRDHRVVVLDLASGPDETGHPGVLEVVRDGVRLADAVRFDPELLLARLGPGEDDEAALTAWPRLAARVPSDVDVVLLSLPPLSRPGVLGALASADRAWLFASTDRTARVDLIAGLDAADRTGTATEVVLLDPSREHPAPTSVAATASTTDDDEEWDPGPLLAVPEPEPVDPEPLDAESLDVDHEPLVEDPEPVAEEPEPLDPEPLDPEPLDPEPLDVEPEPVAEDAEESEPVAEEPDPEPEPAAEQLDLDPSSEVDDDADDPDLGDPTNEIPTVIIPQDDDDAGWSPRAADETGRFVPVVGPDQGEDPVRVAAALQTLAQEVWARDDDR